MTIDEKFTELKEHVRKASEAALMLGHMFNEDTTNPLIKAKGLGFIAIGQLLERMYSQLIALMARRTH